MTQEIFLKLERYFRQHRGMTRLINNANFYLTMLMYVVYPVFLIVGLFAFRTKLTDVFLAPAITFIVATVFRKLFNAKRPYQVYRRSATLAKNSPGQSFPSRHVACAVAIAWAVFYVSQPFGIALFVVSALIAIIRVIGGVHFISDVLFGALIAMNISMLMYVIF